MHSTSGVSMDTNVWKEDLNVWAVDSGRSANANNGDVQSRPKPTAIQPRPIIQVPDSKSPGIVPRSQRKPGMPIAPQPDPNSDSQESQSAPPKRKRPSSSKAKTSKPPVPSLLGIPPAVVPNQNLFSFATLKQMETPLTQESFRKISKLLRIIADNPLSRDFLKPVRELHPEIALAYAKSVRRPMDLGTIARRLHRGSYSGADKIYRDISRVFRNCKRFNADSALYVNTARHLQALVDGLFAETGLPRAGETPSDTSARIASSRAQRFAAVWQVNLSQPFTSRIVEALSTAINGNPHLSLVINSAVQPGITFGAMVLRTRAALGLSPPDIPTGLLQSGGRIMAEIEGSVGATAIANDGSTWKEIVNSLNGITAELTEAASRGSDLSCIWARPCALVWARQSKNTFWPAILLGRASKGEHLSEVNATRIPTSIINVLERHARTGKNGGGVDNVVIEFLGSHEFGWLRDDPSCALPLTSLDESPNTKPLKKKMYDLALDEAFQLLHRGAPLNGLLCNVQFEQSAAKDLGLCDSTKPPNFNKIVPTTDTETSSDEHDSEHEKMLNSSARLPEQLWTAEELNSKSRKLIATPASKEKLTSKKKTLSTDKAKSRPISQRKDNKGVQSFKMRALAVVNNYLNKYDGQFGILPDAVTPSTLSPSISIPPQGDLIEDATHLPSEAELMKYAAEIAANECTYSDGETTDEEDGDIGAINSETQVECEARKEALRRQLAILESDITTLRATFEDQEKLLGAACAPMSIHLFADVLMPMPQLKPSVQSQKPQSTPTTVPKQKTKMSAPSDGIAQALADAVEADYLAQQSGYIWEDLSERNEYQGVAYQGVACSDGIFLARILANGRVCELGKHKNAMDAARAYDLAAKRMWGKQAILNFKDTLMKRSSLKPKNSTSAATNAKKEFMVTAEPSALPLRKQQSVLEHVVEHKKNNSSSKTLGMHPLEEKRFIRKNSPFSPPHQHNLGLTPYSSLNLPPHTYSTGRIHQQGYERESSGTIQGYSTSGTLGSRPLPGFKHEEYLNSQPWRDVSRSNDVTYSQQYSQHVHYSGQQGYRDQYSDYSNPGGYVSPSGLSYHIPVSAKKYYQQAPDRDSSC